MIKVYYLKKAEYENEFDKYVIINERYEIFEAGLVYINYLYLSYKVNTVYDYCQKLVRYLNWLEKKELRYDEVKPYIVQRFIDYLQGNTQENVIKLENKIANQTINCYLTAISNFYKFIEEYTSLNSINPILYEEGFAPAFIHKSFFHHININKASRSRMKYRTRIIRNKSKYRKRKTKEEIKVFRNVIQNTRDALIFDILYLTGMRISELLNLKIFDYKDDLDEKWGVINIVERDLNEYRSINIARCRQIKTGSRRVLVYKELISRIEEYIIKDRKFIEYEEFIFVGNKGTRSAGLPISRAAIEKKFRKYSDKSGIKITPHMLRHTHITELTEAGYDALYIRLRVGHSSVSSTKVYQHPSLSARAEAYKRYFKEERQLNK